MLLAWGMASTTRPDQRRSIEVARGSTHAAKMRGEDLSLSATIAE